MTTRPHSISIRLDGAPVAIDLSDAELRAITDAAERTEFGVSAWAAHVLRGRAPEGLGLSRRAAVRELLLAAAGVSNIAGLAQMAMLRHSEAERRAQRDPTVGSSVRFRRGYGGEPRDGAPIVEGTVRAVRSPGVYEVVASDTGKREQIRFGNLVTTNEDA